MWKLDSLEPCFVSSRAPEQCSVGYHFPLFEAYNPFGSILCQTSRLTLLGFILGLILAYLPYLIAHSFRLATRCAIVTFPQQPLEESNMTRSRRQQRVRSRHGGWNTTPVQFSSIETIPVRTVLGAVVTPEDEAERRAARRGLRLSRIAVADETVWNGVVGEAVINLFLEVTDYAVLLTHALSFVFSNPYDNENDWIREPEPSQDIIPLRPSYTRSPVPLLEVTYNGVALDFQTDGMPPLLQDAEGRSIPLAIAVDGVVESDA